MTFLIGEWLVVSVPHDDSWCSRQPDAVSRAGFTSRHPFKSTHKHATTSNSTHYTEPPLRYGTNILCCSTRTLHTIFILGQPNRGVDKMGDRPITSGTHLWNVMVLAERLEFRVKLVDAILVRLSCQFLHLIGELYGAHEYKVVLHRANTRTRFRWASEKRFSAAVFRSSLVLAMAGESLPLPEGEALADSSSLVAPFATLAFFFLR